MKPMEKPTNPSMGIDKNGATKSGYILLGHSIFGIYSLLISSKNNILYCYIGLKYDSFGVSALDSLKIQIISF